MSAVEEYRMEVASRGMRPVANDGSVLALADAALAEMEAGLAALRDRRCGTCGHALVLGAMTIYRNTTHHPCPMLGKAFDHDFACNRWVKRGAE